MKKLLVVLAVFGVMGAVAIGGALYAESQAHRFAEQEAQQRVANMLPGSEGVKVTIDSWPLLGAVLTGEIEQITVTADRIVRSGVTADDVRLEVHAIALDTDVLWSERRLVVTGIDNARLTGVMSQEAVSVAARAPVEFRAGMVKVLTPQGRSFVATLKVQGRKIVLLAPLPGYEPVEFDLPPRDIVPCTPDVEVLDGALALTCDVTELPPVVQRAMGGG